MIRANVNVMTAAETSRFRRGRYTTERACDEILRRLQSLARGTHSRLAEAMGITPQQLTKRVNGTYRITIDEIGFIADYLEAPTGWPFVPWEEASDRDDTWRNRNKRKLPE